MPGRRVHTDLGRVEELAARVKPDRSPLFQKEIAAELGLAEATFNQRLTRDAELRAAFNRGRARAKAPAATATSGEAESVVAPPEAPASSPLPPQEGSRRALVVDAINRGARTVGKLLSVTRLDHTELTIALQELARLRLVFVSEVGGERQYFLAPERSLDAARRSEAARA